MKHGYNYFYGLLIVALLASMIGCGGGEGGAVVPKTAKFTLTWQAPTTDEGGGALTGLSGYNVYYGQTARTGADPKACTMCGYTQKVDVGNVTTHELQLDRGTYFFAITAYDDTGNESVFSNEAKATK